MARVNRICKICGASFLGAYNALYCPLCRRDAINQRNREHAYRKRLGLSRKVGENYTCELCGQLYRLEIGNQKFCPVCSEIHALDVDAAIHRKERAADLPKSRAASKATYSHYKGKRQSVKLSAALVADLPRIRELRNRLGVSCYSLSAQAQIGHSTLASYEDAQSSDPYVNKLERVASALGMTNRDFWRFIYHDTDDPQFRLSDTALPLTLSADLSRIELLRSQKNLTAHGLAVLSGLDRNAITKLESSAQQDVRLLTLERVAKALDMEPIDLLLFLY